MDERNLTINDLAAIYGITRATLRARARAAGYKRTGRDYILTPDEAKEIIYYRPVGRPRKGDHNVETPETAPVSPVE